jgi:hypothetical protein
MYRAFHRISVMFNQQLHKVFATSYLFFITPTCFDPEYHQGAVHVQKLQPIEIQSIIHVGVTHQKTKTLKYRNKTAS